MGRRKRWNDPIRLYPDRGVMNPVPEWEDDDFEGDDPEHVGDVGLASPPWVPGAVFPKANAAHLEGAALERGRCLARAG